MDFTQVSFHTFGYELPPNVLRSDEIEQRLASLYERLRLPEGRLELMSGIVERRFWDPGTKPSEAATFSGQKVLQDSGFNPNQIEALFFTSVSRDMMEPATASFVHKALNLSEDALVFDISNACLGFLDGIFMLANMIEVGQVDNGLIVSGETAEELMESTIFSLQNDTTLTRKTIKPAFASLTIGSGSAGLLLTRAKKGDGRPRLRHGAWRAHTSHSNLCLGDRNSGNTILMDTDSEQLLHQGVATAKETWKKFSKEGWEADDVDCFFCHQVGSAHAKLLFNSLGLNPEKNYQTLRKLANIGSASAPLTMALAMEEGVFQPGQKGALLGIGSGINCMMLGVEW